MSRKDDVRKASSTFYAAMNSMTRGDNAPMAKAWASDDHVIAQHPTGGRERGLKAVLGSFAAVGSAAQGGTVELEDQDLDIGEDFAIETGVEHAMATFKGRKFDFRTRVTNVYRHEKDGAWKLQLHHADTVPEMVELARSMQGTAAH